MAKITFKAKPETIYNPDDSIDHIRVKVPALDRKHCDMNAFRRHPDFSGFANSNMFPLMLGRVKRDRLGDFIRLDRIPDGVTVDQSGFLATVSIDV